MGVTLLKTVAALAIVAAVAPAARAADSLFGLPVACAPGRTCWVANYVDVAPKGEARDFACGFRTYDGHKGTDFALRDLGEMRRGVDVLAAADGVVTAVRNGMPDVDFRADGAPAMKGRECGNGVRIEHTGGWTTQYCHMRQGSVAVRRGQRVSAGERLGQVGLSGKTIFPHLHFQLARDGEIVDPFTGAGMPAACGAEADPRWSAEARAALPYRPAVLYNAGISATLPNHESIRAARVPEPLPRPGETGVFLWVDMFGVAPGDEVDFLLRDDRGRAVIEKTVRIEERKARQFFYAGKRVLPTLPGAKALLGTVSLRRDTPAGRFEDRIATERPLE